MLSHESKQIFSVINQSKWPPEKNGTSHLSVSLKQRTRIYFKFVNKEFCYKNQVTLKSRMFSNPLAN